jgi:hypothetical protein
VTTFLFVLAKSATSAQQSRMLAELEERFPEHDFLIGDVHFEEYERNIMALVDGESRSSPTPDQVADVVAFFRATMRIVEDWKPS